MTYLKTLIYWPQTFEQFWIIKFTIYISIYYNCIITFKSLRVEIRSEMPRVKILLPLILNLSHRTDCETHTNSAVHSVQWPMTCLFILFSRPRRSALLSIFFCFATFFVTFLRNNLLSCAMALLLKDFIMIGNVDSEKLTTCKSVESV